MLAHCVKNDLLCVCVFAHLQMSLRVRVLCYLVWVSGTPMTWRSRWTLWDTWKTSLKVRLAQRWVASFQKTQVRPSVHTFECSHFLNTSFQLYSNSDVGSGSPNFCCWVAKALTQILSKCTPSVWIQKTKRMTQLPFWSFYEKWFLCVLIPSVLICSCFSIYTSRSAALAGVLCEDRVYFRCKREVLYRVNYHFR